MIKEKDLIHAKESGLGHVFEKSIESIDDHHHSLTVIATSLLSMSEAQRSILLQAMHAGPNQEQWDQIAVSLKESLSNTEKKLSTIGLTTEEYISLFHACHVENQEDRDKIIGRIIDESERKMQRSRVETTLINADDDEMSQRHEGIVESILEKIPVAKNQKILVISGPFAAGKTEIVRRFLEKEDRLEIDLDEIRELLMENYDPTSQLDIQRVREESWELSDLLLKKAIQTGRSVLLQTALHRPERWLNDENIILSEELEIDIEIYVALRPFSDCLVRNISREGRSVAIKDQLESMNGMSGLQKFIMKYSNIRKVTGLDFFPLVERETGLTCQVSKAMYQEFLDFADSVKIQMEIREQEFDIEIINQ